MLKLLLTLGVIISVVKADLVHGYDYLPYVKFNGIADSSSVINVNTSIVATNRKNENCFSYVYRNGIKLKSPHNYKVKSSSFAAYNGTYFLDMDLDSRFLRQLRELYFQGNLILRSQDSVVNYKEACRFRIKGVEFNVEDTLVVFRHNDQTVFVNTYDVLKGTTNSFPFDFVTPEEIEIQINVNKFPVK